MNATPSFLASHELSVRFENRGTVGFDDENDAALPSTASKYVVIAAAASVLFVGVGIGNSFGVFQEYYGQHSLRNERPEKIIVIGSTASSMYFILGAFAGRFADLVGYRPAMLLGSLLMIGALFAASISSTYIELLFSQGIMFGLGLAFVYLPAVSISRQYWKQNHGTANAIVVSGGALGGTIWPYIARQLLSRQGPEGTFRVLGYISVACLLPGIWFVQPIRPTVPIWRQRRIDGRKPPIMDLSLLKDPTFLSLLAGATIAMTGFLPRYFLLPDSAVAQGIDASYASWLLGLMNGTSIIGRIGVGWYADKFGKVNAFFMSFMLCGLGHLIFWLPGVCVSVGQTTTVTAMFTFFVVYSGIFGSGFLSLFPVVTSHLFGGDSLASKQGLFNSIVGIGTLAGPSAVYAVVGHGPQSRWELGVIIAGSFMIGGGALLAILLSGPFRLVNKFMKSVS